MRANGEVLDHFGAEIAHALVGKFGLYSRCGRPEISSAQRARHSSTVAQNQSDKYRVYRRGQFLTFAQRQAGIFDGVVIVDIEVALTLISIRKPPWVAI